MINMNWTIKGIQTPSLTSVRYEPLDFKSEINFLNFIDSKDKKLPKRYIINKGATILFWDKDGNEKTIVKRSKDDKFNKRFNYFTSIFK